MINKLYVCAIVTNDGRDTLNDLVKRFAPDYPIPYKDNLDYTYFYLSLTDICGVNVGYCHSKSDRATVMGQTVSFNKMVQMLKNVKTSE